MTKTYPKLNPMDLEPHYCHHVGAMTSEALHSKSDIAIQLAWRDQRIAELEDAAARAPGVRHEQGPEDCDEVCDVCSRSTSEPHHARQCFENGDQDGAFVHDYLKGRVAELEAELVAYRAVSPEKKEDPDA